MSDLSPASILYNTAGTALATSITTPVGNELSLIVRNIPSGNQQVSWQDTQVSGNITAINQTVSIPNMSGILGARVKIAGTWTGTLVFECSTDGVNYEVCEALPEPAVISAGAVTTQTTVNGNWNVRCGGTKIFRVRASTAITGTAVININAGLGTDYVLSSIIADGDIIYQNTGTLGANASVTTGTIDMLPYTSMVIYLYSNVASATNGGLLEASVDGVLWQTEAALSYLAIHPEHFSYGRRARYMRYTYTNGASPATIFGLQVIAQRAAATINSVHLTEVLDSDDTGLLTRSVITGYTTDGGGGYVNVKVNPSGALTVDASNSTGLVVTSITNPVAVTGTFWQATQPVSGTLTVVQNTGTNLHAVIDSGTITANIGTSGSLALNATLANLTIAQAAQNTGLLGPVVMGGVTTAPPTYANGTVNQLNLTTNGALRTSSTATASGSTTPYKLNSAATTNATSLKASAGQVYAVYVTNTNAAARFLKFYNKASAPTVGTDTPILVMLIPGNTAGSGGTLSVPVGINFSTGIAFAITAGAADTDTTAVALNEVIVNIIYI